MQYGKLKHIAFFISSMEGGGAERVILNLLIQFTKLGFKTDLILAAKGGVYFEEVPKDIKVVNFFASPPRKFRTLLTTIPLANYLKREKPDVLFSALTQCNLVALIAKVLSSARVKIVISEHSTFSIAENSLSFFKRNVIRCLARLLYPKTGGIVAVSEGVADDLSKTLNIPREKIEVIYNPVANQEILEKAKEKIHHPYFMAKNWKVIIGMGRLTEQKDFPTLIKAFAKIREKIDARLIILGEGEDRKKLEELIKNLNLQKYVDLPGFVINPYAYLARADLFVLSSKWEGLSNVLIEALAVGTPVVTTNCPSGPAEILENGKYGRLVKVGDVEMLSQAILETLKNPIAPEVLKERVKFFSVEKATEKYLELFKRLIQ